MIQAPKRSLADIIAEKKAKEAERILILQEEQDRIQEQNASALRLLESQEQENKTQELLKKNEQFSLSVVLNEKQILAKEMAFAGKTICIIGAAGTGKTTAQREIAGELIRQNKLSTHTFRVQGTGERVTGPSIAFVAYTRIASGNLRRAIHKDPALEAVLEHNITTIHNLLEYEPETYWDYEANEEKFRFVPRRTANRRLDITHLVIEEASMVGLDLWQQLFDALNPGVQIIFIGDINQLPPVFGPSILNYALVQVPIVELTHVYRQAEHSSVLENAHRILRGEMVVEDEDFKIIRGGKVQHTQMKMAMSLGVTFPKWKDIGEYDPDQDIILSPFNKQDLGTDNINKYIAQFVGDERGAIVNEIICGITNIYLAIGDRILYNKQVGYVTDIKRNGEFLGKAPKPPSKNLTRFGVYRDTIEDIDDDFALAGYENISLEDMMNENIGEKKKQASHIVDIELENGMSETLSAVGDFSPQVFSLAYALTVHKAQGCEWRKVFLILHKDHAVLCNRELLYTAVTRAREQVRIIGKDFTIQKAINTQKIKGNSIAEKIEYFNSGINYIGDIKCTK